MAEDVTTIPSNQKKRTRKDLLQAASRLMKQGKKPSLEEIAEEALVSRATAYRYFPGVEALLIEASVDVAMPRAEDLFSNGLHEDPVTRLQRLDSAVHDMVLANEMPLRMMLIHSMERNVRGPGDLPARQNRRTPLIEAALAPFREEFTPTALKRLTRALAVVIGTESMVATKDVLQMPDPEARKMKQWMIRALVEAARKPPPRG
ncbi:TetR family transcriptional regulator [Humitalea rosea]|uniref:TetR family transcriptional regulator n=1 Tax=Humitalea rosea TaxID=990373 RepID=A0A2W7HYC8_9PROT|nr:TetR family transcriptional regulator [Humitalea rosea]